MAIVHNASDIKRALNNNDRRLIAGNKKAKTILTILSKLPENVFAVGATSATITAGAVTAVGATAISTAQIWAIISIAGIVLIIGILRAKHARIRAKVGNTEYEVDYDM